MGGENTLCAIDDISTSLVTCVFKLLTVEAANNGEIMFIEAIVFMSWCMCTPMAGLPYMINRQLVLAEREAVQVQT